MLDYFNSKECQSTNMCSIQNVQVNMLTRMILGSIKTKIDSKLTDDQFEFGRGMETRAGILTRRHIIKKRNRKAMTNFMSFVDFEKALTKTGI